jgi:pyridoxine 5-phosphate synthase
MIARLGVNIDHVATIRQARAEAYPSVADAAAIALRAGADQITIHLREDRRHIQDFDVTIVKQVCSQYNKPLNLELGMNPEIIEIALEHKPDWVCIVPEKREEKTTEGGLDILSPMGVTKLENTIAKFRNKSPQTKISIFIASDALTINQAIKMDIDAVEIHTGDYAIAYNKGEGIESYLKSYEQAYQKTQENKIGFHAGHGLTNKNIVPLLEQGLFVEYNIGHWIISDAIFNSLEYSVTTLLKMLKGI